VFVNTGPQPRALIPADLDAGPEGCREVLRLDMGTGGRLVREPFDGAVTLEGYGLAVLSNTAHKTEID
jgi:hypothetical protein